MEAVWNGVAKLQRVNGVPAHNPRFEILLGNPSGQAGFSVLKFVTHFAARHSDRIGVQKCGRHPKTSRSDVWVNPVSWNSGIAHAAVDGVPEFNKHGRHSGQPTGTAKVSGAAKEDHKIARHLLRRLLVSADVPTRIVMLQKPGLLNGTEDVFGAIVWRRTVTNNDKFVRVERGMMRVGIHEPPRKLYVWGVEWNVNIDDGYLAVFKAQAPGKLRVGLKEFECFSEFPSAPCLHRFLVSG